eukprot:1160669-Pelagomonas_calceolata.AAC.8
MLSRKTNPPLILTPFFCLQSAEWPPLQSSIISAHPNTASIQGFHNCNPTLHHGLMPAAQIILALGPRAQAPKATTLIGRNLLEWETASPSAARSCAYVRSAMGTSMLESGCAHATSDHAQVLIMLKRHATCQRSAKSFAWQKESITIRAKQAAEPTYVYMLEAPAPLRMCIDMSMARRPDRGESAACGHAHALEGNKARCAPSYGCTPSFAWHSSNSLALLQWLGTPSNGLALPPMAVTPLMAGTPPFGWHSPLWLALSPMAWHSSSGLHSLLWLGTPPFAALPPMAWHCSFRCTPSYGLALPPMTLSSLLWLCPLLWLHFLLWLAQGYKANWDAGTL